MKKDLNKEKEAKRIANEKKKADKIAEKEAKKLADEKNAGEGKKVKVEHRHISELSKVDRENLEAILRKEVGSLDEIEIDTLKARAAYLTSDEREKYDI